MHTSKISLRFRLQITYYTLYSPMTSVANSRAGLIMEAQIQILSGFQGKSGGSGEAELSLADYLDPDSTYWHVRVISPCAHT